MPDELWGQIEQLATFNFEIKVQVLATDRDDARIVTAYAMTRHTARRKCERMLAKSRRGGYARRIEAVHET